MMRVILFMVSFVFAGMVAVVVFVFAAVFFIPVAATIPVVAPIAVVAVIAFPPVVVLPALIIAGAPVVPVVAVIAFPPVIVFPALIIAVVPVVAVVSPGSPVGRSVTGFPAGVLPSVLGGIFPTGGDGFRRPFAADRRAVLHIVLWSCSKVPCAADRLGSYGSVGQEQANKCHACKK